jgi:hypothetical protein
MRPRKAGIYFKPRAIDYDSPESQPAEKRKRSSYTHNGATNAHSVNGRRIKRKDAQEIEKVQDYLPHVEVTAKVNVINNTAYTVLTQHFVNETEDVLHQAAYYFPLYHRSIITAFRYQGSSGVVEGVLRPKVAARREFEQATKEEIIASLLEQHTAEVIETVIGDIETGHGIKISVHYETELQADASGKGLVLTVPFTIAQRYGTPP